VPDEVDEARRRQAAAAQSSARSLPRRGHLQRFCTSPDLDVGWNDAARGTAVWATGDRDPRVDLALGR
jgi:hypothetical protein